VLNLLSSIYILALVTYIYIFYGYYRSYLIRYFSDFSF